MSQLPTWVQYVTAFSTPIIGFMVGVIAFFQWRTGHQRVVLDLFERRMKIIDAVSQVVAGLLVEGEVGNEDIDRFGRAIRDGRFLFGSEVTTYLQRINTVLLNLHLCSVELGKAQGAQRDKVSEKYLALRQELTDFFPGFFDLVAPYVQMHQKLLWLRYDRRTR